MTDHPPLSNEDLAALADEIDAACDRDPVVYKTLAVRSLLDRLSPGATFSGDRAELESELEDARLQVGFAQEALVISTRRHSFLLDELGELDDENHPNALQTTVMGDLYLADRQNRADREALGARFEYVATLNEALSRIDRPASASVQ